MYLNSEFNKKSFRHLENEDLSCNDMQKISKSPLCVIDNGVFTGQSKNVAMPKDDFANNILNKIDGFGDFDVSEFRLIFNQIIKIIKSEFQ